jgi:hypothetical protein
MTAPRREILLKTVRGNNFRHAMKAIAELRATDQPALAQIVGAYRAPDEQREFQYRIARIVLAHGVRGLVAEWRAKVRMGHHPTGLLDRKVLAAALERIQARG